MPTRRLTDPGDHSNGHSSGYGNDHEMYMPPGMVGAQIAKLWHFVHDQRDLVTTLKVQLMGADGTNGVLSRVRILETETEARVIRLHGRIDEVAMALRDTVTEKEMTTALNGAVANVTVNMELALLHALKKHEQANWVRWVELITTVGTLVSILAVLMRG